ncbi:hypothetical protein FB566_2419 [Stackebrandtia endophytica]|uniref:Secreted protein n=1 Tax=Stackebrandtia endophytica TaxID=1496996 RepID=A0A543AWB5_9ACTN|nr:hypothetical protein [Stackebrandtia endophytica]TQL76877.1 hypothetical protein FB566_2419 [Stackebrandtia endophytica]
MRTAQRITARTAALTVIATVTSLFATPVIAVADEVGPVGFALQTECGESRDAVIAGGEAYWTAACSGATMTVTGWVRDTAADGMCARVKALLGGTWKYSERACPSGTTKNFTLSGTESDAEVYLYLES